MKWIRASKELPPEGARVLVWCAESRFYTGGAVQVIRKGGTWEDESCSERFGDQDPNLFVTHWARVEPPSDVPSVVDMGRILNEETCLHGVYIEDNCEECKAAWAIEDAK